MSTNNSIDKIELKKIEGLDLQSSTIGGDINERFSNIDSNFTKIITSEYLKGAQGNSIVLNEITLTKPEKETNLTEGESLYIQFRNAILEGAGINIGNLTESFVDLNDRVDFLNETKATIVYYVIDDGDGNITKKQVSLLPYVAKDTKFNNLKELEGLAVAKTDLTNIIYWDDEVSQYKCSNSYPTLYYDEQKENFCWKVNGIETGLDAQGLQGADGAAGTGISIVKLEKVEDSDSYIISHLLKINSDGESEWVEINSDIVNSSNLIENEILFGGLIETGKDKDGKEISWYSWYLGLFHTDSSISNTPVYKFLCIENNISLSSLLKTSFEDFATWMKENKDSSLYIPYSTNNPHSSDKKYYSIKSEVNEESKLDTLTLNSGYSKDSDSNSCLQSNFKNNIFTYDVKVVGKLDATSSNTYKLLSTDDLKPYNVGGESKPVYFADGVPEPCGGTLSVSISGNANRSSQADKLSTPHDKVGDSSTPVYFDGGVPKVCSNINGLTVSKAEVANKLSVTSIGNSSTPVYFDGGVPKVCANKLSVSISGNASSADKADEADKAEVANKLSVTSIGNSSKPVYFADGVPKVCANKLSVSISGNASSADEADKAKQFTNAKTIQLTTGATGSISSNFSNNINIPVTSINEYYLNFGSRHETRVPVNELIPGHISPIDFALNSDMNPNRFSFMSSENISVEYSNDGKTWNDYNLSSDQKQSLVTAGLNCPIYCGKKSSKQTINDKVRVTIKSPGSQLYFSLKRLLIQLSTGGASGCYVQVYKRLNGKNDFEEIGKYSVAGWSGWNSIQLNEYFGGTNSTAIQSIRLVFGFTSYSNGYGEKDGLKPTIFQISKISAHGENLWSTYSAPLAANGHMYTWDVHQNVKFPAAIQAEEIIASNSSIENLDSNSIQAVEVLPVSSNSQLGSQKSYWSNLYSDSIYSNHAVMDEVEIKKAHIERAVIDKLEEFDMGHVSICDKLPTDQNAVTTEESIDYTIKNSSNNWRSINSDVNVAKKYDYDYIGDIILNTDKINKDIEQNIIDVNISKIYTPIGITYINDFDQKIFKTNWPEIYIKDVKVKLTYDDNGVQKVIEKPLGNYTLTTYKNYSSSKMNVGIFYPKFDLLINNLILTKSGSTYNKLTFKLYLSYTISRQTGEAFEDATRTKVGYLYTPGISISSSNISGWSSKHCINTAKPILKMQEWIPLLKDKIYVYYLTALKSTNMIYLAKDGIRIINGKSSITIAPPKDGSGKGASGDDFGYIEVVQRHPSDPNVTIKKKKSLFDLLS